MSNVFAFGRQRLVRGGSQSACPSLASHIPLEDRMRLPPELRHAALLHRVTQWLRHLPPTAGVPPIVIKFAQQDENGGPHDTWGRLSVIKRFNGQTFRRTHQFSTCNGVFEWRPENNAAISLPEEDGAAIIELLDTYISRFFDGLMIDDAIYP